MIQKVNTPLIEPQAITGNLIASNTITGNNIANGTVTGEKISTPPDIFDDALLFGGM